LPAAADEVLVAVAANFAEVIEELQPIFAAETGHTMIATTGSTGKLYAQIVAGAPFEVLLSADAATPERLEAEGAASLAPGSPMPSASWRSGAPIRR
jgi:molybdate transport system substrate-binding protein